MKKDILIDLQKHRKPMISCKEWKPRKKTCRWGHLKNRNATVICFGYDHQIYNTKELIPPCVEDQ